MYVKNFFHFLVACLVFTGVIFLVFALLSWLQVPTGRFLDWVLSVIIFWWLLVLVTLPWNMHFRAKEVLGEAAASRKKNIPVNDEEVAYVKRVYQRSFVMAVLLHLASAIGLYALAATGVSVVGYIGCGAALLLTGLRPAIRAYEYVVSRLGSISREIKFPREDVLKLRGRVKHLEESVKHLQKHLNPKEADSWAAGQQKLLQALQEDVNTLRVTLENLRVQNQSEHDRLSHDAQHAIAQMSEDGQVLEHVREIIRFFKTA